MKKEYVPEKIKWAKSMKLFTRQFWKNILLEKEDDKMMKQIGILRPTFKMLGDWSGLWDLWFMWFSD